MGCGGGLSGEPAGLKTIEGFTCPGKETIGPQGLLQAHPVFPHPTDCQYFLTQSVSLVKNQKTYPNVDVGTIVAKNLVALELVMQIVLVLSANNSKMDVFQAKISN